MFLATAAVVMFLATSDEGGSKTIPVITGANSSQGALRPVKTWTDLRARVADLLAQQMVDQYRQVFDRRTGGSDSAAVLQDRLRMPASMAPERRRSAMSPGFSGARDQAMSKAAGPSHHTGTNNQVAGVEEADIVQTDGRHIYTIHGRELVIIKAWPAHETAVVARYRLDAGVTPRELLLAGDRLVLLSRTYGQRTEPAWSGPSAPTRRGRWQPPRGERTRVTVLDIRRRSMPRVVKQLDIEGALSQSRLIKRKLYLVSTAPMNVPPAVYRSLQQVNLQPLLAAHNNGQQQPHQLFYTLLQQRVSAALQQGIDRDLLVRLLPQAFDIDASGQVVSRQHLHRPGDLYVPSAGGQLGMLSLTQLDIDRFSLRSTGILAKGSKIYASAKSVYVAHSSHAWRRGWGGVAKTKLHKFALGDEDGAPTYAASGEVTGTLLNQFSMDEHKGHLRVATTERSGRRWRRRVRGRSVRGGPSWQGGGNHLFVLRQQGKELRVVGSVEGLAKGERIYSARFLGDEGYIVTFRQTDPLFTLDLSNPTRPRVMGELKVNGFSSYMHPLNRTNLLTIGQDATGSGRVQGVHLQIFDVSNLTNPRRTHHHRVNLGEGSSRSIAQSDHHAFTYDRRSGVLAFPISLTDWRNRENSFVGLMLFTADPWTGLRAIGRIDHGDLGLSRPGQPCIINAAGHCAPRRRLAHSAPKMRRAMIIDGYVYSLSTAGLKVNPLASPDSTVASVVL